MRLKSSSLSTNLKQRPALTWVIFLVLALMANAFISYRATRRLAKNSYWVADTLQVITELETTHFLATNAESGQRGYLLTQNPAYLDAYDQAVTEIPGHVDRISSLSSDNPDQQRRISELRQLLQERFEIARSTIELERDGHHAEAIQAIKSDLGKRKMEQLGMLITDMRLREDRLLVERTETSRSDLRKATIASLLASLVALFFVLAFFYAARRELHERIRAAAALRDREAWLQTALSSIGDAVIATNEKGEIEFINRVAEQLLRYSSQDAEGRPLSEVLPIFNEATGAPAVNPVATVIREGAISALTNHTILRNRQGEEIPIEDSAAPIVDASGMMTGVVMVFRDVTEQRRAQESARTAEKLAAAGRLAATIAHEINNPLEAATNLLFLAQTSACPEETKRYVAEADRELGRMAHITRKTLTFYRSSAVPTPTNICTVLEEILDLYEGRIQSRGIKAEIDCAQDIEIATVKGDLMQIASNLISNALDAMNRAGRLKIKVVVEKRGAWLDVEDDGSGIPAENLQKVFEPFFTTKRDTGTGLGLWVVKDLVEKLGGKISVVSPTDHAHGTRFSLFLPAAGTQECQRPETKAS